MNERAYKYMNSFDSQYSTDCTIDNFKSYKYVYNAFDCETSANCTKEDFRLKTISGMKIRIFVEEDFSFTEYYSLLDSSLDSAIRLLASLAEEAEVEIAIEKDGSMKIAKKLASDVIKNADVVVICVDPFWVDVTIKCKIKDVKIKKDAIQKAKLLLGMM